jgi:hypothetical protein
VPKEYQKITPELLDAALQNLVGRLPEHTYKNGIYVPPMDVKANGAAIRGAIRKIVGTGLPPVGEPVRKAVAAGAPKPKPAPPPEPEVTWKTAKQTNTDARSSTFRAACPRN